MVEQSVKKWIQVGIWEYVNHLHLFFVGFNFCVFMLWMNIGWFYPTEIQLCSRLSQMWFGIVIDFTLVWFPWREVRAIPGQKRLNPFKPHQWLYSHAAHPTQRNRKGLTDCSNCFILVKTVSEIVIHMNNSLLLPQSGFNLARRLYSWDHATMQETIIAYALNLGLDQYASYEGLLVARAWATGIV